MNRAILMALRARDLRPAERLLLAVIASYANDFGVAYPTTATLAEVMGYTTRGVQKALQTLEKLGYIQRAQTPWGQRAIKLNIKKLATQQVQATAGHCYPGEVPQAHDTYRLGRRKHV